MTDKKQTINDDVLALSKQLAEGISIAKDGTVTIDKDLYIKTLPESLPVAQVEAVQDHNGTFFAAAAHAFGNKALDAMQANKEVDVLTGNFHTVGKDEFTASVARKEDYRGVNGRPDTTSYGVLSTKYMVQESRAKIGQLGKVRDSLQEAAMKALGE